ncbi:hypothetical protein SLA2020_436390 [Shorea laevis]
MASKPGILTDWPWKSLGSLKYVVLAPWVIHSTYSFVNKDGGERDFSSFLIFPFLLWRMLHNQIWISLSRYWAAKAKTPSSTRASNLNKLTGKAIGMTKYCSMEQYSMRQANYCRGL